MRRIATLAALAALPLVSTLVGCDDSARPADAGGTVAVGSLPGALATSPPTAASTSEPATTESVTTEPTTTEPSSTEPEATEPETIEPRRTSFVDELAGLVEGDVPDRLATSTVRDDSGRLRIDVPREWSQHRTEPARFPDGSEAPSLAASPDLTAFLDGYATPGMTALVVADDPDGALDAYAFEEDCTGRRRASYLADGIAGRYDVWESCGGTSNDIVTIAVRPDGSAESVLLLHQVVGPEDLRALDQAVESLTLRD